jgi:hypothetical protein
MPSKLFISVEPRMKKKTLFPKTFHFTVKLEHFKTAQKTNIFLPMSLQPLLGPGLFFNSVVIFYTDGSTPWTSDKPVARPLPTHRTTQTQNIRIHRHLCIEWDSNPRSQHSIERRQRTRI